MIDDDLFRRLKRKAADEGTTLQQLTNRLIRQGLAARPKPFKLRLPTWNSKLRAGVDLFDRDKLYDLMEGR